MERHNFIMLGLCMNYILLSILDAVTTIYVIEMGLGFELSSTFRMIIDNTSLYYAMLIKMAVSVGTMAIIYSYRNKYDDVLVTRRIRLESMSFIYGGLLLINIVYYGIVVNNILVIGSIQIPLINTIKSVGLF